LQALYARKERRGITRLGFGRGPKRTMTTTTITSTNHLEAAETAALHFKDYLLENVYLRTTELQRLEIITLWEEEGAISDPNEAERRSHEAVFLVRTAAGELAGLSTVGFARVKDGRTFYAYRMFLRKQDRAPYLMLKVVLS